MSAERLAFGPFRLNTENGTLLRDGALLRIGQKSALILGALLKSKGEVLTKAQLMDAAWPEMTVEESNLSVQIASLRKALGAAPDSGEWIVTVPRVGYRLFVEVQPRKSPAATADTLEPITPPSPSCRLKISAATRSRTISPTAWSRTSSSPSAASSHSR